MTEYRTIPELLADAAAAGPDRPWLISGDKTFTFAETEQLVGRGRGRALPNAASSQGDIVLVVGRNFPAQVFTWLGLARLGAVMLPVNPSEHRRRARSASSSRRNRRSSRATATLDPVVDEAVARVPTDRSPSSTCTTRSRASPDDAPRPDHRSARPRRAHPDLRARPVARSS